MASGSVVFEDGLATHGDLGDADRGEANDPGTVCDLTSALTAVPTAILDRLVTGDPAALEFEQGITWAAAVRSLPDPEQRVALGLRALEQALPPSSVKDGWKTAPSVQRFLFVPWRDEQMLAATRTTLESATGVSRAVAERMRAALASGADGVAKLDAVASMLPTVIDGLPEAVSFRQEGRYLLDCLTDRESWSAQLEVTFLALLSRAVRVRNAVLHGGAVEITSVESVDAFISRLTQIVNEHREIALTSARSLLDVLEDVRVRSFR